MEKIPGTYNAVIRNTAESVACASGTRSIDELEGYINLFKDSTSEQKWIDEFWHDMAVGEALIMARRIYERNT